MKNGLVVNTEVVREVLILLQQAGFTKQELFGLAGLAVIGGAVNQALETLIANGYVFEIDTKNFKMHKEPIVN